jgi:organic hydroperoxide reductase OsmC/OhrA
MKRTANAHWNGTLQAGQGEISTQSTVLNKTQYSFKTRFADGIGTNPEELISRSACRLLHHGGWRCFNTGRFYPWRFNHRCYP